MDISELSSSTGLNTPSANVPDKAATNISADFETFLKMLTVQMQNQDPLNPIDSADYAVQLATFSGVEQQVQTNDLLRGLAASLGAAGLSEMAGWVGMEARTTAPATFTGAPLTITPTPDPTAQTVQLVVRNSSGAEVQRMDIAATTDPVTWTGIADDGTGFPYGEYTFQTASFAANGELLSQSTAQVYRRVTEVQAANGQTIVILDGGVEVNATEVTALRDPAAS